MTVQARGWLLVLCEPTAPDFPIGQGVLGLALPLRLALVAQDAGARAVLVSDAARARGVDALLHDARLAIPVVTEADRPRFTRSLRCASNLVVHRADLEPMRDPGSPGEIRLPRAEGEPPAFSGPRPPGFFEPIAVRDKGSRRRAERALLQSLRKPQDGWTSTHLNRHISLFFTRWLVATPLKPNQLSVAILGVGLLGAFLAARGTYLAMLAGALLFQAQSVLDGCDGEMSRITFRRSRLGEWLDTVGDDLTNYGFFAGAAWGLYASTAAPTYLVFGAITVACGVVTSFVEYRYLVRIGSGDLLKYPLGIGKAPGGGAATSRAGRLVDAISPLFKRDTFALLTLVAAALGQLGPVLAVFSAGAVGILAAVVAAEARMARGRRAAG